MIAIWRSRPVFVTSTFRDMHAEREHLNNFVFPALAERLRERYHHLEAIDLRWGVETSSAEDEEKREILVLKVCLGEIERSRPFLIGLLGDRYGWVPPAARARAAASEAGLETDLADKSITELEIEHGLLASADQRRRSRFYFRNSLPYDKMLPKEAAKYSDQNSGEPGAEKARERLAALKGRIEAQLPDRVRRYDAKWEAGKVTGLEEWGNQVTEDLWEDLEAETREFAGQRRATWQQEEAFVLDQFVETQCRDFVGRREILDGLLEFAESEAHEDAEWCYSVTGPSGSGKSALFAELKRRLDRHGVIVLAHAAGISSRAGQIDSLLRRWTSELAGHLGIADPCEGVSGRDLIEKASAETLSRAAVRQRVVCLIDALNQFDPTPAARHLTWLPELWPLNARMIATAIPGFESSALEMLRGVRAKALPELSEAEAGEIARTVCLHYHKNADDDVVAALTEKKTAADSAAAGMPLWLELALEHLVLLEGEDFERAEREFVGRTAGERLHAMVLEEARRLPAEIGELYGYVFARTERLHGEKLARGCAALIGLSRTGWREEDLAAMLRGITGEAWDPLRFAALRRGMRAHLVQRGASAQWDFVHAQARETAVRLFAGGEDQRRELHAAMAQHLRGLEPHEPLRETETIHHLIEAGDARKAAKYYGGSLLREEEIGGARDLASAVVVGGSTEPNPGIRWVKSMLDTAQSADLVAQVGRRCGRFVGEILENEASRETQKALQLTIHTAFSKLVQDEPDSAQYARDLSVTCHKLGQLFEDTEDMRRAREYHERALRIREEMLNSDPDHTQFGNDLAFSCERMGDLCIGEGDFAKAREYHETALGIRSVVHRRDPDNERCSRDLSVSYGKLGGVWLAAQRPTRAREFYEQELQLAEALHRRCPGNDVYTRDLAISLGRLGKLLGELGELERARQYYEHSFQFVGELRRGDPENAQLARDYSVVCECLGDLLVRMGQPMHAQRYCETGAEVSESLFLRFPDSTLYSRSLAVSMTKLGDVWRVLGGLAQAEQCFSRALEIVDQLYRRLPSNAAYARDASVCYTRQGDLLMSQRAPQAALQFYERAIKIAEDLYNRAPDNAEYSAGVCATCDRIGNSLLSIGNLEQARQWYERSHGISEELLRRDSSGTDRLRNVCLGFRKLGSVSLALRELDVARQYYEQANAIATVLNRRVPNSAEYSRELSETFQKLGDISRDLGDSEGASQHYQRAFEGRAELYRRAPGSGEYARELAVACQRLWHWNTNNGRPAEAEFHKRRLQEVLLAMKAAGLSFDRQLSQLLNDVSN